MCTSLYTCILTIDIPEMNVPVNPRALATHNFEQTECVPLFMLYMVTKYPKKYMELPQQNIYVVPKKLFFIVCQGHSCEG